MRTYPTLMIEGSKSSSSHLQKHFCDKSLKSLGKGKNGISTPLVLSIRPYIQIFEKHAKKKGTFHKVCIFHLKTLTIFNKTILVKISYSLSHRHVHYNNYNIMSGKVNHSYHISRYEIKLLYYQIILTIRMNKITFDHKQRKTITHEPLSSKQVQ